MTNVGDVPEGLDAGVLVFGERMRDLRPEDASDIEAVLAASVELPLRYDSWRELRDRLRVAIDGTSLQVDDIIPLLYTMAEPNGFAAIKDPAPALRRWRHRYGHTISRLFGVYTFGENDWRTANTTVVLRGGSAATSVEVTIRKEDGSVAYLAMKPSAYFNLLTHLLRDLTQQNRKLFAVDIEEADELRSEAEGLRKWLRSDGA